MEILSGKKLLSNFQEENTQTKKQQQLPHSLELTFSMIFRCFCLCKSKLLVLERALWANMLRKVMGTNFFPEGKIFSASNKFWLTLHMLATGRRIRLKLSIYLSIDLSIYLSSSCKLNSKLMQVCSSARTQANPTARKMMILPAFHTCSLAQMLPPPSSLAF